jgi:hypothetical protein
MDKIVARPLTQEAKEPLRKQIVRKRKAEVLDRKITGLPIHPQASHLFHQRSPVQVEESGGASLHTVRKGEGVTDHFQLDVGEYLYQVNASHGNAGR